MKKNTESGESGKVTQVSSTIPKGSRVIPSRVWLEGGRALWRSLAFREKALILMGILVPALDQISRLASLGVTMKAVSRGIRQPLDLDSRLWLGLIILGATGISALIQLYSGWVKRNLKGQITRMIRRIYGRMMADTSRLPLGEREKEVENLVSEERNFVNSATSGMADFIEFVASLSIVVFLLIILTWFNWVVGAIILGVGLTALLILKFKIKSSSKKESDKLGEARDKLANQFENIAEGRGGTGSLIDAYANNQYDRLAFAEQEAKTSLQKKISSAMNFGSAILMAVVFLLVSAEGAFDEQKVVWMVVFIFGLRMVVAHGKSAMVDWGSVLGTKQTLMTLAKGALLPPLQEVACEAENENDATRGDLIEGGRGPRIVDYKFSGLDGAGIVSRESLVLEMTVETDSEIKGFYWSFSILPVASSIVLVSKTSEDSGITWNLPAGRSRFRMVSGPVWIPAGTYAARVGIAKGNRLLDLSVAKGDQATITVLPDEAAKRSIQTRLASDVVIMDVEWEIDFQPVELEQGKGHVGTSLTSKSI